MNLKVALDGFSYYTLSGCERKEFADLRGLRRHLTNPTHRRGGHGLRQGGQEYLRHVEVAQNYMLLWLSSMQPEVREQQLVERRARERELVEQRAGQQLAEQRVREHQLAEQRALEQLLADQRARDHQLAERRAQEQQLAERRAREQELVDQRAQEQELAEWRVAAREQHRVDQRARELHEREQRRQMAHLREQSQPQAPLDIRSPSFASTSPSLTRASVLLDQLGDLLAELRGTDMTRGERARFEALHQLDGPAAASRSQLRPCSTSVEVLLHSLQCLLCELQGLTLTHVENLQLEGLLEVHEEL